MAHRYSLPFMMIIRTGQSLLRSGQPGHGPDLISVLSFRESVTDRKHATYHVQRLTVSLESRSVDSLKFGRDFDLDVSAYELRRAGRPVRLARLPMEILILLIERRPKLVTREQIA